MKTKGRQNDRKLQRRDTEGAEVPHPGCFCVNAADKGVSERFGVKAADKGLMGLDACGDRSSCGEKEGPNGDTVSRTLGRTLPHPLLFVN
jgi:hypothetical protein